MFYSTFTIFLFSYYICFNNMKMIYSLLSNFIIIIIKNTLKNIITYLYLKKYLIS